MKIWKKIISVLLSFSMLFSLIAQIGITAFAAEKEITNRAEWLSALAKTFQMTVESDNYPDNYFSDLTEASEYYYDVLLAVEFGVVDIEAGDPVDPEGEISREFAAQTLNFCLKFDLENLENEDYQYSFADYEICNYPNDDQVAVNRGWFALDEDGNFCPELTASSDELAFMIDDAKAVIKADAVDENYDSTYEFKDGVIEISSNTDVEILDDNTVVIYNTKYDIKNGDTFVVFSNDIPIVYQAEKVTVNKDNITIRVADKDCEDAVESIDMEEVVDLDASGFIPADGFEIVDEPVSAYSLRKAPSAKNSVNLKKKINLISGNSINIEIKISDIKASYKVKSEEESVTTKVDFNLSYKFDGQFNFTDIAQDDLDDLKSIGTIPFMGIGFIEFKPELNFNGKTEYSQKYNVVLGFTQDKSGTHNISSFKKDTFKFDFEGSCKFGVKVEIGLKILAVKIGVYAEVGAMAKASAETSENENNVSTYCLTLSAHLYFKVGVELKIDFLSWKSNPKIEWEIYKETNSPVRLYFHFENGQSVDKCSVNSKTKTKYVTPSTSIYGSVYEGNLSSDVVNADDFEISTYFDGTAEIAGYKGNATVLNIPEYINGYRITSIGDRVFSYRQSLKSVTIPDSVTSVGVALFYGCNNLESVVLSENITSLKNDTCGLWFDVDYDGFFEGCTSLTNITIPNSVTSIGLDTFRGCKNLKSVTIPNGVKSINKSTFSNCTSLASVTIPNGVTYIYDYAFHGCTSLKSITIPNGVTYIGNDVFLGCRDLTEIIVDKNNKKYDSRDNCNAIIDTNLNTLVVGCKNTRIPNSVTSIGSYAFYNCSDLTNIEIPNSVTSIGYGAFEDCTSLESVTIENGVTSIGERAFFSCTSLKSITIPNSVTSIGNLAFYDCTSLTNITIPNSVTSIGDHAFYNCTSLKSITIPNSVTSIGDCAFEDCTSLTNITIPNSVTSIGDYVFYNCTSLESITIPNSVTSINDHAFYGCKSLTSITIENKNCEMGYDSIPAYVTIYGYKNSTTERYAKENGNKFVAIDAECSHTWGNGKVTKAATCTANGVKTYTCTNCGGVKTETIKATGHKSVTDKAVAATCTTAGKTAGSHCSVCNTVITAQKAVPATGHSYDAGKVTKQPTATATGVKTYTCTICGATKTETIPVTRLKAPTAKAVVNANGGFTISWNKVAGADKYDVYYDNGTGYKLLRTVTGTSTTTGTAPYGKKYSYKVRAVNSKNSAVTSAFSSAVTAINNKKLQTPTLKATVNANGSFKLSWNKVTGATRYGIYMLESNGKYKWIKSTSATSWTTGTAQYGKKYTYKVFAVNDNTSAKSAFSSAVSATNNKKLQSTTAKVTVNANGSFKISWNKVTGATKYGIYMKQSNGSYKWIKTVTGTSWTTGTAQYNKQYSYKVLVANNNKSAQTFSNVVNAKNTKKLQTPSLKVAVNKNGSFKLSWGKVIGATSYQIYMKQANGSYKLIKTTTSTSFTTAVASKGKTYSYKVRAVTSKNKNATSAYSNVVSVKRK